MPRLHEAMTHHRHDESLCGEHQCLCLCPECEHCNWYDDLGEDC